jgi:homocysteine S-methyltransferase
MSDLYEIREAIRAAKETCKLPIVASVTFTRDDRTVLGDDPAKVARTLKETGVDVMGVNCSGGPAQLLRILKQMGQAVPDGKFWVKPNAGWPEQVGGRIMYPADPEYFGEYALSFREVGACIIGGCCGTTPQHIASMRKALASAPKAAPTQITIFPLEASRSQSKWILPAGFRHINYSPAHLCWPKRARM